MQIHTAKNNNLKLSPLAHTSPRHKCGACVGKKICASNFQHSNSIIEQADLVLFTFCHNPPTQTLQNEPPREFSIYSS